MKIYSLKDVEGRLAAYGFVNTPVSLRSVTYGFLTGLVLLSTVASGVNNDSSNSASADANQKQIVQQPSTKTQNPSDVDGDGANSVLEKSKANASKEDWATKLVDYCTSLSASEDINKASDTAKTKLNCLSGAYSLTSNLAKPASNEANRQWLDGICADKGLKAEEVTADIDFTPCQTDLVQALQKAGANYAPSPATELTELCQTDASSFSIGDLTELGKAKCNSTMTTVMALLKPSSVATVGLNNSIPDNQAAAPSATKASDKDAGGLSSIKWWQYLLASLIVAAISLLVYLLIRHLNSLNDSNRQLQAENQALKNRTATQQRELANAKQLTSQLEQQLREKQAMLDESYQDNTNSMLDLEPVTFEDAEPVDAAPLPELEAPDFEQLSATLTKWITSNRGNTQFESLLPAKLADKLKQRDYQTLLWTDSDGVNSIKPTDSTRHTAVISFTTPDNQGYAFCYKKPNAMASQWQTGAWYQVALEGNQLKCLGALG